MDKRGQATIFIIVAIFVVVGGVLVYFFYPQISSTLTGEIAPNTFLQNCVNEEVNDKITLLANQGGYANPEGYILYNGNRVKYLCYTAHYANSEHPLCRVQQPLLKAHFENELNSLIRNKVERCVEQLSASYERRGYEVSGPTRIESQVDITLDKIRIVVDAPMSVRKESSQVFDKFNIEMQSKMYDLLIIAISIIDFESSVGEASTDLYTRNYPNIRVQKIPSTIDEGTNIYTVESMETKEKFTFASRSLAWPPGIGING